MGGARAQSSGSSHPVSCAGVAGLNPALPIRFCSLNGRRGPVLALQSTGSPTVWRLLGSPRQPARQAPIVAPHALCCLLEAAAAPWRAAPTRPARARSPKQVAPVLDDSRFTPPKAKNMPPKRGVKKPKVGLCRRPPLHQAPPAATARGRSIAWSPCAQCCCASKKAAALSHCIPPSSRALPDPLPRSLFLPASGQGPYPDVLLPVHGRAHPHLADRGGHLDRHAHHAGKCSGGAGPASARLRGPACELRAVARLDTSTAPSHLPHLPACRPAQNNPPLLPQSPCRACWWRSKRR